MNSLHEPDELTLVGGHFEVTRGERLAEKGQRSDALM